MSTISKNIYPGKRYLFIFLFWFIVDLVAIYLQKEEWRYFSKPLLMPFLAAHFLVHVNHNLFLRNCILAAMFFSWAGDVLLMFQSEQQPAYFLLGLSCFLMAHVFYILFYYRVRANENIIIRWWLVVVVALYYVALITVLYPHLGDMRIPVLVYGMVISGMLLLAVHMLFITNKIAGVRITAGAVLFVISDSMLALNMFYRSFEGADLIIMLTYGFAQFLIVTGAMHYISSKEAAATPALVS